MSGPALLIAVFFVRFVKVRYDISNANQFAAESDEGVLVWR